LKETTIDWADCEGKSHKVGWYVYEWCIEKRNVENEVKRNQKLEDDNERLQKTNATISSNLTQLEKRMLDITKDNKALRLDKGVLEGIRKDLLDEIDEITQDLTDSQVKIEKLSKKIEDLSFWDFIKLKFGRG
jgi:predicted transcriptional regulator